MTCVPLKIDPTRDRPWDRKLEGDMQMLARFVQVYCDGHHADAERAPFSMQFQSGSEVTDNPLTLCPECRKLLTHACVKRSHCPMHPKPQCKNCPSHCYHPTYRAQIREVMKYSGRKLVMQGRVDYLLHLLF
jgi:Nitrous oxide-stimulated promoter